MGTSDIFLIRLVQDIAKWYDQNYVGIDKELVTGLHIHTILSTYDKERFARAGENLPLERTLFLQETQHITELRYNDILI